MAKILVTGSAGFIGFHLTRHLLGEGHEVVGLDNLNDYYEVRLKFARLEASGILHEAVSGGAMTQSHTCPGYRFIQTSLESQESLGHLFDREQGFDYIVHLAAQAGVRYSLEHPEVYVQSNVAGTLNILEQCRRYPVKHLVFASSSSVYGDQTTGPRSEQERVDFPVSLYAATKKSTELMAHAYSHLFGIPATGLRYFTVYGPWGRPDMSPILFARAIAQNEPIQVFNNGLMERDFTYIDDIVEGTARVLAIPPAGAGPDGQKAPAFRVLNIGYGQPSALMDFIGLMEKHMGKKSLREMLPMQPGDVLRTWADTTALQALTGYKPRIALDEGIARFVDWFRQYYFC